MSFLSSVTASSPTVTPNGLDGLAASPTPTDAVGLVQEQLEAGKERTCFASTDYAEG
jgi:hypothetical protein